MSSKTIRIAYGSVPKDSGTFTFYRNLRPELLTKGIDIKCVSVGLEEARLWENKYADGGCVLLAADNANLKHQAMVFAKWCEDEKIDIVMGINSIPILSSLPHLSENIRVVSRCANGFDHGYRITMSCSERLMGIVALTPKLQKDLITGYGANAEQIVLIPNGINPIPFKDAKNHPRGKGKRLELGFLGRLEHNQKGVLHIPKIVQSLNERGVPFRLRIAGKGRHSQELKGLLADDISAGNVEFLGPLTPKQVPGFLNQIDIFVFTSHFEGCPNALLEAMMAGAIPISWLIKGTTDFIIEDGKTGFLAKLGDSDAFAAHIETLHQDRAKLGEMHKAVLATAQKRFVNTVAAKFYARFFHSIVSQPAHPWVPKPWAAFKADSNFPQTIARFVPAVFKSAIRNILGK